MKKNLIFFCAALMMFVACTSGISQTKNVKSFGAPITPDHAITYDELIPKMTKVDSLPIKVTGTVKQVCQKKGCWMTLVSTDPTKPEMRVTFKDYGFFMPKDISGKSVVIDGYAYIETTSVDILRHYAEDAGKSKAEIEAIKEPLRELSYEAAGVLLMEK
jgi:hypothetical protein